MTRFAQARPTFKPIRALGTAVIVLSALSTVGLIVLLLWFLAGGGYGGNVVGLTVAVLVWLVYVVSGGLAMAWLWRARQNAVLVEPTAPHTLPQVWVVLGWLVPIVSYWFPVVVIRDIARASVRRPMGGLLGAWWAAHLVGGLGGSLGAQLAYMVPAFGLPLLLVAVIAVSVALVLWASIIHIIGAAQHERADVPVDRTLRMTGQPLLPGRRSASAPVGAVAGTLVGVLALTAALGLVLLWRPFGAAQSAYYPSAYPTDTYGTEGWTQPTTQPAYPTTTRPPTPTRPPSSAPTTTYAPAARTVRVTNTCGAGGAGDCYVMVRMQPYPTSTALAKVPEGTPLNVVCQVRGARVSSSALGTSSDVWSRLESGGYVASIFTDDPGKYAVATPC